jgi:predicted NACHT family NTPase
MTLSRSLHATQLGLEKIKAALQREQWSYEDLAGVCDISRSTATKFCQGKAVSRKIFKECCARLGLDSQDIAGLQPPNPEPATPLIPDIDTLVQQLRQQGQTDIEKRCGTMRVLDMTQPITANSIYTAVNILEKINSKTRAEIAELMQGCDAENFERFILGAVRQERIDGLEAVARQKLLMILGRPGAGKTTFLKRLAMFCVSGEKFASQVPLFVSLKEFADFEPRTSLIHFMAGENQDLVEAFTTILKAGRGLVLLDGLDEVQEAEHDRVLGEIRGFARRYSENQIIITCRIAAREYIFEQFTEVEVADFNHAQIADFVTKWFLEKDSKKSKLFLENLKNNKPVQELAINPLLLTLLSLEFEGSGKFPKSRSELYKRGLDELLVKWDGERNIKRQEVYKELPRKRKESMLGYLAMHTFENGDYFFKEQIAETQISQYIENLPNAQTDPEALRVDSSAVLKAIEAHHGLLTERARGIYSFSHLTFHEYFVAFNIVESSCGKDDAIDKFAMHVTEKRWREVFLLVVEQLEPADHLLQQMKRNIDDILVGDTKLQQYLGWVQRKAQSIQAQDKLFEVRAYYYTLDFISIFPRDISSLSLITPYFYDDAHSLFLKYEQVLKYDQALANSFCQSLGLPLILDDDLDYDHACVRARTLSSYLDSYLSHARHLHININNNALHFELLALQRDLSNWQKENLKTLLFCWQEHGKTWMGRLRQLMITHCDIGHDWQFTPEQDRKLLLYYDATFFLVECLNSECRVTRSVREEIEAMLMMPVER